MSVLVSGSIAYDFIFSYEGNFGEQILAGDPRHLNLTFFAGGMSRCWGGCAGNIAYALKLLGGDPVVLGAVGFDGGDYLRRFEELGIRHSVKMLPDTGTSQGFVTTDSTGAQLTTYYPGALLRSHEARWPEAEEIELALVGPDGREAMVRWAGECRARRIPYIFDLGQAVTLFSGAEIRELLTHADYVTLSDFEMDAVRSRASLGEAEIAASARALIVTHGPGGSTAYTAGGRVDVAAVPAKAADPVGAGDAFRGGLLYGLVNGLGLENAMRLGSVMGAAKVEARGAQGYKITLEAAGTCCMAVYGGNIIG